MSTVNCCSFQRSSSPDLPNSRVIQAYQENNNNGSLQQLDPIPLLTTASTMGSAHSREIREIFASSEDENARANPSPKSRTKRSKRELQATIHHKESSSRLSYLAERLKRKISREAGLSRKRSRMRLKNSWSEEDIQRRQELKRALHRRLQEDLLRDRSASEGGYDEDALPIATPHPTLGRSEGFDQIDPEDIAEEIRPADALPTSDRKFSSQSKPEKHSPKVTTIQDGLTVRKVLRKKRSAPAAFHTEQHPPNTTVGPEIRLASGQSTSPFHFNNLAIPKRSRISLRKASVERSGTAQENSEASRLGSGGKGASGLFGRSTPNMRLQFGYVGKPSRRLSHKAKCDPATEELGFGGIDGVVDSHDALTTLTKQNSFPHQETQAPKRLASRAIRVSLSLSQLGESSSQWHKRSTSSVYSRQPNTYRSSSQHSTRSSTMRGVVSRTKQHSNRSNDNLHRRQLPQHIASSVYSSHGRSRQSIANLDGSREPHSASRRQSTAYDLLSTENKEVTSLWERAFQGHAQEDGATSGRRRSSMLPRRRGSLAIRKRASVSQDSDGATSKREVPEVRRQGLQRPALRRLETYSFASSRRSVSPSGRVTNPIEPANAAKRRGRDISPARPTSPWCRFPSHTRAERSTSPASSSDGVYSRDFALEITRTQDPSHEPFRTCPAMDKRKSRSLTFKKSMRNTLGKLHRSQAELRGFDRGHRSSISAGGVLEYPELELPAGLGEGGATGWSKMYEDCVPPRDAIDESSAVDLGLASPKWRPDIRREAIGRT